MCIESHIFASHGEDCSTGEEQRCRRHDHHNGGDVHCVQSEESLMRMAVCSQESGMMANAFRDVFRVSLKRFFWPPWDRFSCCSSP